MALQIHSVNVLRLLVWCNRGAMFVEIYGWFPDGFDTADLKMSECRTMN
jgi:hypothetical protein